VAIVRVIDIFHRQQFHKNFNSMLRYTFNRAYRFNLFNFNRLLSTQSLDVSGTIPGKTCHVVDGKWRYDKESRISSPGRFYAFLQFNGRKVTLGTETNV
jgi:hypothetical protein